MKLRGLVWMLAFVVPIAAAMPAAAHAPSGAIFTTVVDGSEVNFNIYPSKPDVYLDGGPGPGAPQTAAGLDDGTYVFMVTNPSGKVLLSTDAARCRQFTVANGIITGVVVVTGGCQHATGDDIDHGAKTVQLIPFDDTPNPGGVYKVWVTFLSDFPSECLATVDCSVQGKHGFLPRHSKTDNFKVGPFVPTEIDTRFFDTTGQVLNGREITWIDTLGSSNQKWSYYDPNHFVINEAHVEAPEAGIHQIVIEDQRGCKVGDVYLAGKRLSQSGPQSVNVHLNQNDAQSDLTIRVDVICTSTQ